MTIKELRQVTERELVNILREMQEKLRELRFKAVRRELKNVREVRDTKRTIARIMTLFKK